MKLGEGISYHASGVRPAPSAPAAAKPGAVKRHDRPHPGPAPKAAPAARKHAHKGHSRRPSAVVTGIGWPRQSFQGMGGFWDFLTPAAAANQSPEALARQQQLQDQIAQLNKTMNGNGFTPGAIVPALQAAVSVCQQQTQIAAQATAGNVGQLQSDAANNLTRAQRMLAQMQSQASAGDVTVYSNPSPTWAAVKDALLGPLYFDYENAGALGTQAAVDAQIPAIVLQSVLEAPATIAHAAAAAFEGVADAARKATSLNIPWRWIIGGVAVVGVMWVARPYVAPLLRRI